jgi:hypothetical protein
MLFLWANQIPCLFKICKSRFKLGSVIDKRIDDIVPKVSSAFWEFYIHFNDIVFHWVKCCLPYLILVKPFRVLFWLRNTPLTWWRYRVYGKCDRSTGDVYSLQETDPTSGISRDLWMSSFLYFVLHLGVVRLINVCYFSIVIFPLFPAPWGSR